MRLHGADPELVEEIRQLGLRYGILTEYTSYLVEEPELALDRRSRDVALNRAQQAAAAPEEQVGAVAFEAARKSSRLREADALDAADEALVAASVRAAGRGGAAGATAVRRAGRRLFALRDGTWTDLSYEDSLKVIEVAPFSRAYFQSAAGAAAGAGTVPGAGRAGDRRRPRRGVETRARRAGGMGRP